MTENETVEVLFGSGIFDKEIIISEVIYPIGFYKDDEGNDVGVQYNPEAESWMNRHDMQLDIFKVKKEELEEAAQKYEALIRATWSHDLEESAKLKKEFLQLVGKEAI